MIGGCKLLRYLQSEAVNTNNFLIIQSPTINNFGKIPKERFSGKKLDVSFL